MSNEQGIAVVVENEHRGGDAALATVDAHPVGDSQCCASKHYGSSKRAKGLEPSTFSLEGCKLPSANTSKHSDLRNRSIGETAPALNPARGSAHIDPDLQCLIDAWPTLPVAVKARILGIIEGADTMTREQ